jgi:hypothetical protein
VSGWTEPDLLRRERWTRIVVFAGISSSQGSEGQLKD